MMEFDPVRDHERRHVCQAELADLVGCHARPRHHHEDDSLVQFRVGHANGKGFIHEPRTQQTLLEFRWYDHRPGRLDQLACARKLEKAAIVVTPAYLQAISILP